MKHVNVGYTARQEYTAQTVVDNYITHRFSGPLGRYRYSCEQRGVNSVLAMLDAGSVSNVLDCPTGIGRWIPHLVKLNPTTLVAADVSATMLERAGQMLTAPVELTTVEAVAEDLPFDDSAFDLVFCHALLKHLPEESQAEVLREMARVSRRYVVCALSVLRGPAGLLRRARRAKGAQAVTPSWIASTTQGIGLRTLSSRKVTTPIGVEYSYLFERTS